MPGLHFLKKIVHCDRILVPRILPSSYAIVAMLAGGGSPKAPVSRGRDNSAPPTRMRARKTSVGAGYSRRAHSDARHFFHPPKIMCTLPEIRFTSSPFPPVFNDSIEVAFLFKRTARHETREIGHTPFEQHCPQLYLLWFFCSLRNLPVEQCVWWVVEFCVLYSHRVYLSDMMLARWGPCRAYIHVSPLLVRIRARERTILQRERNKA